MSKEVVEHLILHKIKELTVVQVHVEDFNLEVGEVHVEEFNRDKFKGLVGVEEFNLDKFKEFMVEDIMVPVVVVFIHR